MDNKKFGCFVASRRKELNMTQKELASKIMVTDKAVSKWERGLGLPDINLIEDLAKALHVSIIELMKSEKKTETMDESDVVNDVIQIAKKDSEERRKIIMYVLVGTTIILTILEIVSNLKYTVSENSFSVGTTIPYYAIVPGVILMFCGIFCKIRGKKISGLIEIGGCLLLFPIVLVEVLFLIYFMIFI